MNKRRRVYEGKAKVLYEGPEPGTLIQHFKDDATAFNNKKHALIEGKGVLNNRISEHIFTKLGEIGVPTHFMRRLNMREQLIREVEIIPLEVVVRNVAAGSLAHAPRAGGGQGRCRARSSSSTTRTTRSATRWCREEHITAFGWATPQEIDEVMALALRINDFLVGLFLGIGIRLVDFKVEFGRLWENEQMRIVLADEISPDCCRLWDARPPTSSTRTGSAAISAACWRPTRKWRGGWACSPRTRGPRAAGRCWSAPSRTEPIRQCGSERQWQSQCLLAPLPTAHSYSGNTHEGAHQGHAQERRSRPAGQGDPERAGEPRLHRRRTTSARASTSRSTWPRPTKAGRASRSSGYAKSFSPTPSSRTTPTSWCE